MRFHDGDKSTLVVGWLYAYALYPQAITDIYNYNHYSSFSERESTPKYYFADNGLLYVGESIQFEFQTVLFAALLYIIASYSMRWWSSNCRHTPIPQ